MQIALLIGFVIGLLWFIEKMTGTSMVIRPIVVSPIIGLILGNLEQGVKIGVSLELMFIGAIQIGAAIPPDVLVGAGLATAFAILSDRGVEVAIALALPIAVLAQSIKIVIFIYRSSFMSKAMKYAEIGEVKKIYLLNLYGLILQCLMYFGVSFVAIYLGSSAVEKFISVLPETLLYGLKVSAGIIPAVGFALLLQPMLSNYQSLFYFILGFALFAYLNIPIIGITVFAIILAYIIYFENKGYVVEKEKEDDLFDN